MPQIGKQGDGVHTCRGVHGVLVLTMMGVSWCVVRQHSCTRLHWWQWLTLGSEGDGVHTRRGVHGVLVLTMMGVSVDVWWTFTVALTSVTAVAQIGKRGGWCAHSQESARHPCAYHDGCVGWCVVNQHSCTLHWWWQHSCTWHQWRQWPRSGSEGGMVCTLEGECMASLGHPWWVCLFMSGEPAQLHFTLMTAVAQIIFFGWGWGGGWGGKTNNDVIWMQDLFIDPVDCAIWQTLHAFSRMCCWCEVATVGEL